MKAMGQAKSALIALALCASAGAVSAGTVVIPISGSVGAGGAFTGSLTLDLVGGQAISGGGDINIYGLTNAPLTLITASTPGDEPGPSGTFGFRGNDGTDLLQWDTAYPVDANGLLFDVGTHTASWGAYPLFGIASNGDGTYASVFTGKVDGTEHYFQVGSATLGAVPEPATWSMMLLGVGAAGGALRMARRKAGAALA